jgi:hypothetical protein
MGKIDAALFNGLAIRQYAGSAAADPAGVGPIVFLKAGYWFLAFNTLTYHVLQVVQVGFYGIEVWRTHGRVLGVRLPIGRVGSPALRGCRLDLAGLNYFGILA